MTIFEILKPWLIFLAADVPMLVLQTYMSIFASIYNFIFGKRLVKSLHNEVAVVIAASSSRFGCELAYRLAQANVTVVILDRQKSEEDERLMQRIVDGGDQVHFRECDTSERNSISQTVDAIEREIGGVSMLFYGNLLDVDQQNEKLLKLSYVNLIDTIYPRMMTNNRGHLVFISLVNSFTDFKHLQFVEGLFNSILPELHPSWGPRTGVRGTLVNIHKNLLVGGETPQNRMLGNVSITKAVEKIISGIRQNKKIVEFPSLMNVVLRLSGFLPHTVSHKLLKLIYA